MTPQEIAESLGPEERAVLIAWSAGFDGDDPPDYPRGFVKELEVMERLQKQGLFVIEECVGGDTRYYSTDLGRAVAKKLEG